MDVYSLEEEGPDNIFLTQTPRNLIPLVPNFEVENDNGINGVSLTQNGDLCSGQYSDISDGEDVSIPSSQIQAGQRDNR